MHFLCFVCLGDFLGKFGIPGGKHPQEIAGINSDLRATTRHNNYCKDAVMNLLDFVLFSLLDVKFS